MFSTADPNFRSPRPHEDSTDGPIISVGHSYAKWFDSTQKKIGVAGVTHLKCRFASRVKIFEGKNFRILSDDKFLFNLELIFAPYPENFFCIDHYFYTDLFYQVVRR